MKGDHFDKEQQLLKQLSASISIHTKEPLLLLINTWIARANSIHYNDLKANMLTWSTCHTKHLCQTVQIWPEWGGSWGKRYSPCPCLKLARNSLHRCSSSLLSRSLRKRDNEDQNTLRYSVYTKSIAAALSLLSRLFVWMTVKFAGRLLTKLVRKKPPLPVLNG